MPTRARRASPRGMRHARPRGAHRAARALAAAPPGYVRRRPEDTVLYAVVEEHAEAFFARLGELSRAWCRDRARDDQPTRAAGGPFLAVGPG